jgi:2-succinyl-5-enolpyruvyl-6-hydroxy-3-cyclohexene-1-carboxylate synthase
LHWRIDPRGDLIDTYHRLDGVWDMQPLRALQALLELPPPFSSDDVQGDDGMDDQPQHQLLEQQIQEKYKQLPYSDSWAMNALKPHLQGARVHLGNSSLVRKFLALPSIPGTPAFVHCNRGTSGIEGNVSTALGDALVSKGL